MLDEGLMKTISYFESVLQKESIMFDGKVILVTGGTGLWTYIRTDDIAKLQSKENNNIFTR